jgi:lysylphosphatidylglycerol synthetase-like protein (DUF2156 family)
MILGAVLIAAGIGLAASASWLLLRPVLHLGEHHEVSVDEARAFVDRHGGDTLAYFSLREDKHHAVYRDTLFAYAVHNGVCLLSPDPIGPPENRVVAWTAFRADVSRQGWPLAVLGAAEEWLPVYRASGMRERYIGDEAVVDVSSFSLDGGAMKGLRQAVNRIAKYGYTIEFYDPSTLDPALCTKLRSLMTETRRGGVERGFSMTLSRVFQPEDKGLLLAVCFTPEGEPAAFCQYVPAPDIGGYSLDLMRRSAGEHPNGLTDFVVVRTIEHVRDIGGKAISLNFATMRAVLAGETGEGFSDRMQRAVLERLGDSMQIESLWKYNAKFKPTWRPRFLVYDAPENLMAVGLAMAAAEQWWELPVIGRFLGTRPDEPKAPRPAAHTNTR